jgi:hypothetical protein
MPKVEKIIIAAYEKMDCSGGFIGEISLQVNPEKISFEYRIETSPDGGGGGSGNGVMPSGGTGPGVTPHPLLLAIQNTLAPT